LLPDLCQCCRQFSDASMGLRQLFAQYDVFLLESFEFGHNYFRLFLWNNPFSPLSTKTEKRRILE